MPFFSCISLTDKVCVEEKMEIDCESPIADLLAFPPGVRCGRPCKIMKDQGKVLVSPHVVTTCNQYGQK